MPGFATPAASLRSDDAVFNPKRLTEVIGQQTLIRQLIPEIKAAIHEKRTVVPAFFYGPPGLGKSRIAELIGMCRGVNVVTIQGSSADDRTFQTFFRARPSPMVGEKSMIDYTGYQRVYRPGINKSVWQRTGQISPTVLIINEADGIKSRRTWQNLQDVFAADDLGNRYFVTQVGGEQRDFFCPEVTPIIITNYADVLLKVAAPIISRCAIKYRFESYTEAEIALIIQQFATKVKLEIETAAATLLAERSCGVPRAALQHFAKARAQLSAYCEENHVHRTTITLDMVKEAYQAHSIDDAGLDPVERHYMMILFAADQKTLALERISNMLNEGTKTIEALIEPNLYRRGMVQTAAGRGRQLTGKGVEYCVAIQQTQFAHNVPDDFAADGRHRKE